VSPAGGDQSTGPSQRGRRDSATGVQLLPAPAPVTHRITRSSRGPLDPPLRGGAPDASWSRYDVAGRTVYLAATAECAYAEVLAYTKRRLGQQDPLTKDAAAVGLSVAEFSGLVGAEWSERQHMGVGHLPSSWRIERLLYRITVPEAGRWVDIQHPDSLAAAETELEAELATLDLSGLTVAALLGDDRHVTTAVARWGARPTPGRRQHPGGCGLPRQARHRTLLGLLATGRRVRSARSHQRRRVAGPRD